MTAPVSAGAPSAGSTHVTTAPPAGLDASSGSAPVNDSGAPGQLVVPAARVAAYTPSATFVSSRRFAHAMVALPEASNATAGSSIVAARVSYTSLGVVKVAADTLRLAALRLTAPVYGAVNDTAVSTQLRTPLPFGSNASCGCAALAVGAIACSAATSPVPTSIELTRICVYSGVAWHQASRALPVPAKPTLGLVEMPPSAKGCAASQMPAARRAR